MKKPFPKNTRWVNYRIETKVFQKSNPDNFRLEEGVGAFCYPLQTEEQVCDRSKQTAIRNEREFIATLGDDWDTETTFYHSDVDFMKEEGVYDAIDSVLHNPENSKSSKVAAGLALTQKRKK